MRERLAAKLVATLITGVLAFFFQHSSTSEFDTCETLTSQVFLVLFIYSVASLIFRWGWVVPCVILGVLACMVWEACVPALGRGYRVKLDARVWRMVFKICIGFVVGVLMGIRLEYEKGS
ncbi:hypothetical protein [Schlesneria paludicola]|uniref:hypothetical protein n=1 Tax=Schlesneria paludicola TaxID=360056 RepID=UPI000299FCCA|nr:hypothetical protein [Schlesneria paludicola]